MLATETPIDFAMFDAQEPVARDPVAEERKARSAYLRNSRKAYQRRMNRYRESVVVATPADVVVAIDGKSDSFAVGYLLTAYRELHKQLVRERNEEK